MFPWPLNRSENLNWILGKSGMHDANLENNRWTRGHICAAPIRCVTVQVTGWV